MLDVCLPAGQASVAIHMLCGLIYSLGLTGLGQQILPFQVDGSRQPGPDGTSSDRG
jgi:K+-transporting ATPase c subunit